jgi:hexokinase
VPSLSLSSTLTPTDELTDTGQGRDVVALLQEALLAKGIDVNVACLANDTVGTLFTTAYSDPNCRTCSVKISISDPLPVPV